MSGPLAFPTIGPFDGAGLGTGALSGRLVCGRSLAPTSLWTARAGAGEVGADSSSTGVTVPWGTGAASVVGGAARVVSWVVPAAEPRAMTPATLPPGTATTPNASA